MLVAGSDCSRTLDKMAKHDNVMGEVEEGEISDATSVEEISEEDFNKQDTKNSNSNSEEKKQMAGADFGSDNGVAGGKGGNDTNPRVWTMRDLLSKYPACRGYAASGLYNLAWAQAVQNKPLNEVFVMDVESSENSKGSSESTKSKEDDQIVIENSGPEKEEGELEEGEIDLESEPASMLADENRSKDESGPLPGDAMNTDSIKTDTKDKDLEDKVKSIRGVLESTSMVEAHKSFEGVCFKLLSALESLKNLVLENDNVPKKDILVQLSFAALQTINSVFCSLNHILKERNKETVSRLLSLVKSNFSPFLSPNQIKEMETMIHFLNFSDAALSTWSSDKEKEGQAIHGFTQKDHDLLAANIGHCSPYMNKLSTVGDSLVNNKVNLSSEASKRGASSIRNRAPLLPLLDLHKDHDLDSLPSPTRETSLSLPVNRTLVVEHGLAKPEIATVQDTEDAKIHPYANDALKAVSTYQQKFGRTSFFRTDNLPSPTPSEESNTGNGDIGEEVSSSSLVSNSKPLNNLSGQPIVSPSNLNKTNLPGLNAALNIVPKSSVSAPANPRSSVSTLTIKSYAKSRDPRLRFVNTENTTLDANQRLLDNLSNNLKVATGFTSSRKQKGVDEPFLEGPALKRQKNGLEDPGGVRGVQKAAGSGGWLEDIESADPPSQLIEKAESNPRKMENGATYSTTANVMLSANVTVGEPALVTAASLPSLLKDIAVNPTMLINLLTMGEKQKAIESTHQKPTDPRKAAHLPGSNSMSGAVSPVSVPPSNASVILPKPVKTLQVPSQAAPSDEPAKIRMKPRDPRRVLHGNTLQRTGCLVEEQLKVNEPPTSGSQGMKDKIEGQVETKALSCQLVQPHDVITVKSLDIAPQFTKNPQSVSNLVAVPQVCNPAIVPQNPVLQTVQVKADSDVKRLALISGNHQSRTGSAPGTGAPGPPHPQSSWGDLEHLFEGYDDQQKAAIQRERTRRIEEQKKMFAERKLCLVLDLDHTLLNSAKFIEVDPVHDEILRRKEEQDREKPYRHLFRFPHMGMWTKLRPGIWNFLEKASKLYELHLYTMGNKLYATEMAKVLDPKGTLFNGRVISRGDDGDLFDGDERVPKSKDLEGVLGMESAVVIIDDSVRVWPHNKMNLIVVERYTYFPCSRRQFGLLGPSLLEIDHDERPEDGTLASSLTVIERIHQNFFSHASLDEADVRNILAAEQRKILAGCRIVFSRVFPVGEVNPHLHPLWQTAEQFGAVCTNQVDEHVTHVVANSLGTDKVNWAMSRGRFVVHPGWVEASALLYRRANENDFAIKP